MGRKPKRKNARGKPWVAKWNDDRCRQVYEIALLGATEPDICRIMDIHSRTFETWKQNKPEFLAALQDGRDKADAKVAKALFHRAIGYSHPDVHISNYKGEVTITQIMKHYPPDSYAALQWLKIRQRILWSDPTKVDINANLSINHNNVDMSDMTTEQLELMEQIGMKRLMAHKSDN